MIQTGVKDEFDELPDGRFYNEEAAKFIFMAEIWSNGD